MNGGCWKTNLEHGSWVKWEGEVRITILDPEGNVVEEYTTKNLVVNTGLDRIRDLLSGASTAGVSHMAIGDGDATAPGTCAAPAATDTALGNELARVAVTATNTGTGQVKFSASFTPSATWNVCEAGLFDAATAGTMIARTTFGPLTIDTNFTLNIDWTITIS